MNKLLSKVANIATVGAPVIGIAICCIHLFSKRCKVQFHIAMPSLIRLWKSCQLGSSAFVTEMSSGVTTLLFNFLILRITGNVGVAAYGVVANVAMVSVSVFNGIAQGGQPLISENYGKGEKKAVNLLRNLSFLTAIASAIIIYGSLFAGAKQIVEIFNHDHNTVFAMHAEIGIKLYFTGIFFSSINIVGNSFFGATEKVRETFVISSLRGFILIILSAFLLSWLFGMNGIWLAYMAAEAGTSLVMFMYFYQARGKRK